ncbi:hypothetical protein CO024_00580 [Candidatus Gracilibacteria bacterium CG_4_9_14_0_2_um_filter_38_7]|nr:MAG: hypothetical protein CO024_00580 [Candidatus Gracilibacteria bacterium CG_4_9_14_0_2_um_filter_38_7]
MIDDHTSNSSNSSNKSKSHVLEDFIKIEQFIQNFPLKSSQTDIEKLNVYELVQERLSTMDIKDITSAIVMAIISKKEVHDLRSRNIQLQGEISRIMSGTLTMEEELDILYTYKCILDVDTNGIILEVNDFMVECSGYSREELIGKNMHSMSSGIHSKNFWNNFWNTIRSGRGWAGDICNKKKDGSFIWLWTIVVPKIDKDGNIISFKVIRQDVSESYELFEQKVDNLTKLPNYTKCLEDFSIEKNRSLALLHINNMIDINDVFGRERGDEIIKEIAEKLRKFSSGKNLNIYKFEGTDFAIVFKEDVSEQFIQEQYNRLSDIKIFDSNNKRIHLSFSLGVVLNEPNIEALLRHGQSALNKSKQKKRYVVFDNKNNTLGKSKDFFEMRSLVREAFKEDLFEVFFQEIKENFCAIKKGKTKRFECLVRMYDSKEKTNLISPGKFLPIIKEDGEDEELTSCVIEKVCKKMIENDGHFSINLTEDDLTSADFTEGILKKISKYSSLEHKYPVTPNRITFEILEEIESIESGNIRKNIKTLKDLGFSIAIDDFGSGYSNFSRMFNLEPDFIKIDMRYVRGIDKNQRHRSLVRAIVGLAHDNDISVIGEGIETEQEQLVMESLGVDYSQGFLFSKPTPIIEDNNPDFID